VKGQGHKEMGEGKLKEKNEKFVNEMVFNV
jgi:hypothetical protein